MTYNDMDEKFTFFKFDFDDSSFSNDILYTTYYSNQEKTITSNSETSNPVYIRFHYTMIHQLSQRTFLEMILGSKASRNEDRFYSTLPLSEYQERKSEVSHWKISSMISVKLKLYEIMNIKDKMILLFWSINKHALTNGVLPTFATSTLPLDFQMRRLADDIDRGSCNFDLDDQAAILLQQTNNNNKDDDDDDDDDDGGSNLYYLRLKPKGYFMVWTSGRKFPQPHMNAHTCKRLGINTETVIKLDVVYIPAFDDTILDTGTTTVVLVGSFDRNKWVITEQYNDYLNSFDNYHRCTHSSTVSINQLPFFNVY
ncbi:hypothetical protein BCR42DRAFT_427141 [Absidia repens]|uniref:Uncharacterized protein n=1 Tax=Absidia repens TaxID=90262 RepID=A0A1X2I025_9FUNG|nr:hypothetical protein BCR42DRAFT_427141 [Absidia repens]